jgi:hypothetical protein
MPDLSGSDLWWVFVEVQHGSKAGLVCGGPWKSHHLCVWLTNNELAELLIVSGLVLKWCPGWWLVHSKAGLWGGPWKSYYLCVWLTNNELAEFLLVIVSGLVHSAPKRGNQVKHFNVMDLSCPSVDFQYVYDGLIHTKHSCLNDK